MVLIPTIMENVNKVELLYKYVHVLNKFYSRDQQH